MERVLAPVKAILWLLIDVLFFWQVVSNTAVTRLDLIVIFHQRLMRWLTKKQPASLWLDILQDAKTYEEWEEAAFQLDVLLGNDLW